MKKRFLPLILILAALLCFGSFGALAAGDCSITAVLIDEQSYAMPAGEYTLEIGSVFTEGSRPRIILQFSNNMHQSEFLAANLEKISLNQADINGNFVRYEAATVGAVGDVNTRFLLRADEALAAGKYKIIVEPGMAYHGGTTPQEYDIFFNVGAAETLDEPQPPGTARLLFEVKGVKNDIQYIISVRKADGSLCPANSDGSYYLAGGDYNYAVSAAGYVTETGSLTVSGSEDLSVSVNMRDYVYASIETTPKDAKIQLKKDNDQFVEPVTEGGNVFIVTPGLQYTYLVSKEGYTTESKRFIPLSDTHIALTLNEAAAQDGYGEQGVGGNSLTMLEPADIEVIAEREDYFYNKFTVPFPAGTLSLRFTLGSGMGNFDEENFLVNNLPQIGVYACAAAEQLGEPVSAMLYEGFDRTEKILSISSEKELAEGTYIISFGKNIRGNNFQRTLGKDILFEFTVGAADIETSEPLASSDDAFVQSLIDAGQAVYAAAAGDTLRLPAASSASRPALIRSGHLLTDYAAKAVNGVFTVKADEAGFYTVRETDKPFSDLAYDYWSAEYVYNMRDWGIFNGYPEGDFKPQNNITRAEFVKALAMTARADVSAYTSCSYSDVNEGDWYLPYIAWAEKKAVVRDAGGGNFFPDSVVTRQDMAYWIYNCLLYMGMATPEAELSVFSDGVNISNYAQPAVSTAVALSIINGFPDGSFKPFDGATREQAAKMLFVLYGLLTPSPAQ